MSKGRELLTITEAAKELGVLPDSLRQAVLRGAVQAERAGGIWLVTRAEIERYRLIRKPNRGRPRRPRPHETGGAE